MSAIQLSGLVSGVDWSSLVTQLVDADRTPETAMKTEQTTNTSKISALATLNSQFTALQSSLSALQDSSLFTAHNTSLSNGSLGWTASGAATTPNGSYNVAVTQLAAAAARQGAIHVGGALSATSDVSGLTLATLPTASAVTAGNFQINGATVSVSLTDSVQDVFNKISTATNGTVAASYDPTTDKVSLQSTSGNVVLGASNDTSNFLSVFKLSNNGSASVSSTGTLGSTQLSKPLAQSNLGAAIGGTDASGNGSFSINGTAIAFNVNTDSVQSVMNRINNSSAGVTASYDVTKDRFTLTDKTTGDLGLSVTDASNGFLNALGVGSSATLVGGQDAQFSINGGDTQTSHSNTLTDPSTGLSVTAATTGTSLVTVNSDSTGAMSAINDFIAKYNAIQTTIAADTAVTVGSDGTVSSAILAGNHDISDMASNLRSLAFTAVPGANGAIAQRLQSFGIDFVSGTSTLAIKDPTALSSALASNGPAVANFFQNSTNGLASQLNGFITKTTSTTGTITTQTNTLNSRNSSLTDQVAAMERKLTAEQASLTAEFTAMEAAEATSKGAGQALTDAFGGGSTTTTGTATAS